MSPGSRKKPPGDTFKDFVLEQLETLAGLRAQRMFGGWGLYANEAFFGIAHRGRLYFRTHEGNRADYVERGMRPFRPNPDQTLQRYYEVPADVLEDTGELVRWAVVAAVRSSEGERPR